MYNKLMNKKPPSSVKVLLSSLVRIPSVNKWITGKDDAEHELALYVRACAKASGLDARLLEVPGEGNNLLITKEFKKSAPWLMFAAHMDTVSSEGMEIDPFGAEEKNNRIYGRGSCDDKGSLAAAVWALKETAAEGKCPNNIAILCTIDEEQHRNGATAFAGKQLKNLGFMPAGVIVAEPTLLKPVVAHAGIAHFTVTVKGKAAHASEPSKGRSAIKDMVRVMDALEKEYINKLTATDPLCGKAQCSINMIQGGRQVNAIPDECYIKVDRRVMPGEKVDSVLPDVEKVLEGLRRSDPSLQVSAHSAFTDDPLAQDLKSSFIQNVLRVLERSGLDAKPIGAQFATDAGVISRAGLPCVVLGPGDGALAHTANESMGVGELEDGVRVFKALMNTGFN
jgi:acetylornithine deacetylase